MIREIERLIKRLIKKDRAKIFTTLIGQVVSYDGATNTCSVIPVQRRIRTNDPNHVTTVDLPQLDDIPVEQFGSGKMLFSVAPQVGSYGKITVCQRSIENWAIDGGIGDPDSARTFDISDSLFSPGLYPQAEDGDNGLIAEPIKTDRIELRTRSALTSVAVKDDETVEIKNEKCTVSIDVDGNVSLTNDGTITFTSGDTITLDNGVETLTIDSAEVKAGTGTDFTAMSIPTDLNFTLIDTIINAWVPVPMDGGAALKTAWLAAWPGGKQATASGNLKAD
jgi:hypothetical protein